MRCSPDHHNLLVAPGRVPYLNHYALEHDDFDAVMKAATIYLEAHDDDRQIAGPGRHQIGGNIFWYMLDPAGNFFEYFAVFAAVVCTLFSRTLTQLIALRRVARYIAIGL